MVTGVQTCALPIFVVGDGPERARLGALAGPTVSFAGHVSDGERARLLAGARGLVFPGEEDFGIAPVEAMASGTPVIAVARGGVRETVINDRTGWLLPPDADAFAAKFVDVLAAGASLEPMRAAARSRALEFSWDHFVQRIDDVMEEIGASAEQRS